MTYCIECGKKIPDRAKFCKFCGADQVSDFIVETTPTPPAEEQKPQAPKPEPQKEPGKTGGSKDKSAKSLFTLLADGYEFKGYKVLKHLNTDAESVKYIVSKIGSEQKYVLRLFHKSFVENIEHLYQLQMRMKNLKNLRHRYIAPVVDTDTGNSSPYMIAQWAEGKSLAELKETNPEYFTEENIRRIGKQLIEAAMAAREQNLTLNKLSLVGILLDDDENIQVLSSGINYDESDEREDIFTIGIIISQLLSKSVLYASIYSEARLRTAKFSYINGTSLSLNKVLADALHRNILQRYKDLETLQKGWESLPAISGDEIYQAQEQIGGAEIVREDKKPKGAFDIYFWILILLIIASFGVIFTTNIFSFIFGDEEFAYTGFFNADSLKQERRVQTIPQPQYADTPESSAYVPRQTRTSELSRRTRDLPGSTQRKGQQPSAQTEQVFQKVPDNFVQIRMNSFGFGRGKGERPNVTIDAFYMSRHEVTQAEWRQFMTPAFCSMIGDDLPVDNVSWNDIIIYCNARSDKEGLQRAYKSSVVNGVRVVTCDFKANGYRLPSEAEWELAAKAGMDFDYSGSDDADDVAWYSSNSSGKIRKVGLKKINPYGLYDMTGNVAEWVWDWFDPNYIRNLPTFMNPSGPANGTLKSIRGGSVMNGAGSGLNILSRDRMNPASGRQFLGFRLVRTH